MFYLSDLAGGKYPVGATTFSRSCPNPYTVGSAKYRLGSADTAEVGEPALRLEETVFTVYYPADISAESKHKHRKGLDWLIRPVEESLRGYAKYAKFFYWILWPIVHLFGRFVKIPVYPNAPLIHPPPELSDHQTNEYKWPLVIFSHGLGGNRTSYSQLCQRLASSGRVVIALDHRDGTAPMCMIRSPGTTAKVKLYLHDGDDTGLSSENLTPFPLRTDQLIFRKHEIYLAYTAFRALVDGLEELEVIGGDDAQIDWESWSKGVVCHDADVTLMGHSFGGATMFSLLSSPPPAETYPTIPVTKSLLLDPWLEPLPTPGPSPYSPPLSSDPASAAHSLSSSSEDTTVDNTIDFKTHAPPRHPQLLVINSQVFSLWEAHFTRLKGIIDNWEPKGGILTLIHSRHASFSDFYVLPLVRTSAALKLIGVTAMLALAFLDGRIAGPQAEANANHEKVDSEGRSDLELELEREGICPRKMEIVVVGVGKDGKKRRTLVGDVGDVIVH